MTKWKRSTEVKGNPQSASSFTNSFSMFSSTSLTSGGLAHNAAVVAGGIITNGGLGNAKLVPRIPDTHATLYGRHRLRQLAG
jgi:hypothetical protein